MRSIIRNSIQTPDGTELHSKNRYDYVSHKDKNGHTYAIDGGIDYQRINAPMNDYINTSIYSTDTHEIVRDALKWGTYGKNGDEPLKRKPISELTYEHIKAIIETQTQLSKDIKAIFVKELKERDNNIYPKNNEITK